MPILIREQERGEIVVKPKGSSVEVRIRGVIGVAAVVRGLRDIPNHEDLSHFPEDEIKAVIESLRIGLGEVDQYLTTGGAVTKGGTVGIYSEYNGSNPELIKRGYWLTPLNGYYSSQSKFIGGFPFGRNDKLHVAAPGLGKRLRVARIPDARGDFTNNKVSLLGEGVKGGFLEGATQGFGNRFKVIFGESAAKNVFFPSFNKVVASRFYDYANGQIPATPLEQM